MSQSAMLQHPVYGRTKTLFEVPRPLKIASTSTSLLQSRYATFIIHSQSYEVYDITQCIGVRQRDACYPDLRWIAQRFLIQYLPQQSNTELRLTIFNLCHRYDKFLFDPR